MKSKIALLSLAMVSYASADQSFYITGATAFRTAAIKSIISSYSATGLVAGYRKVDASTATLQNADKHVIKGTFGSLPGITTIYTFFNGSVEGIKALALDEDLDFLAGTVTTSAVTQATAVGGTDLGSGGTTLAAKADLAFSDVFKSSTPYGSASLFPSEAKVGVIAFTWVANNGADAGLTNVTTQSARAILTSGFSKQSQFSGVKADSDNSTGTPASNKLVFLTGRNDGSGTRTTFLAEVGYPIALPIKQYKPTISSGAVTNLTYWPAGLGAEASTIWENDIDGNGGYASGGNLVTALKATTPSGTVSVSDSDGSIVIPAATRSISMIGYQSTSDAASSISGGARTLSYNGFPVTYTGSALSATTRAALVNGQYTMWGYEQLYSKTAIDTAATSGVSVLYTTIKTGCNASNLSNSGIPLSEMLVSRTQDGGTVAP
jgi:hypothetical protein